MDALPRNVGMKARGKAAHRHAQRRQPADGTARLPGPPRQPVLMKIKHGIRFSWLVQRLDKAINSSFLHGFKHEPSREGRDD